jgi:hypothetical protein
MGFIATSLQKAIRFHRTLLNNCLYKNELSIYTSKVIVFEALESQFCLWLQSEKFFQHQNGLYAFIATSLQKAIRFHRTPLNNCLFQNELSYYTCKVIFLEALESQFCLWLQSEKFFQHQNELYCNIIAKSYPVSQNSIE